MNDIINLGEFTLPTQDKKVQMGPTPMGVTAKIKKAPPDLPFCFPWELQSRAPEEKWLIEGAWSTEAVGIIGGAPKSFKTWAGLEMAVSVATGTDFLGRFKVRKQERVLVFLAEDAEWSTYDRLVGIAHAHGTTIDQLDHLKLVTRSQMRLDLSEDQEVLESMLAQWRPSLLVVDPIIRVHGGDENSASDVSGLLGYFRALQRRFHMAVAVAHHTRKAGASTPGQALRGSTDFHGWGDSFLHLKQMGDVVEMSVEHRSARSMAPITLALAEDPVHLTIAGDDQVESAEEINPYAGLEARIGSLLMSEGPLKTKVIGKKLSIRLQDVTDALNHLKKYGFVGNDRKKGGWYLSH